MTSQLLTKWERGDTRHSEASLCGPTSDDRARWDSPGALVPLDGTGAKTEGDTGDTDLRAACHHSRVHQRQENSPRRSYAVPRERSAALEDAMDSARRQCQQSMRV